LETDAPAIVVRLAGYRSVRLTTQGTTGMRVVMQKLSEKRSIPACPSNEKLLGISVWWAGIKFPKSGEAKASRLFKDLDYVRQAYRITSKSGSGAVIYATGPQCWATFPLDEDVWQSTRYEEVSYDDVGNIDSRGQLANGNWWRNLGNSYESASYENVGDRTARVLARFMDSACFSPIIPPSERR